MPQFTTCFKTTLCWKKLCLLCNTINKIYPEFHTNNITSSIIVMDYIRNGNNHRMRWAIKGFVLFCILINITYVWNIGTTRIELSDVVNTVKNGNHLEMSIQEDIDSFRRNKWPKLQNALCGAGFPNVERKDDLANYFFNLARLEVFSDSKDVKQNNVPNLFFNHDMWGYQVYSVSEGNPSFQMVYVKAWKCANNQLSKSNMQVFGNKTRFPGELERFREVKLALDRVHLVDNQTSPVIPPCIYTVVRDPISHFLSGYNEVEYNWHHHRIMNGKYKIPKWQAPFHHKVPYIFPTYMVESDESVSNETFYSLKYDNRRKKRFEEFVKDLLRQEIVFALNPMYYHTFSMSAMLTNLATYNQTLTGYIPSIKNVIETWPKFIAEKCPGAPELKDFPKLSIDGQHGSSKDPFLTYKAAKEVWKEKGEIARALCLLHTLDYSCWKDLPDGVPDICMNVYQKYYDSIIAEALRKDL